MNELPLATHRSYRVRVALAGKRTRLDELRVRSDCSDWLAPVTVEPLARYGAVGIPVVNPPTSERQDLLTAPILSEAVR